MLGLDYAAKHSEGQLREAMKAGVRFVVRYLAPPYLASKILTADEVAMLRALGLGVVSVYQRRNNQIADFDVAHARLDAQWALDNAREVGQSRGPIYFAMDFDAQSSHIPTLQAYVDEVARLLKGSPYEVGVYGSYRVMEEIDAPHKWQTYAWSGGRVSKKVRLLQCHNGVGFVGGSNDLNVSWGDPGCWIPPADTSFLDAKDMKSLRQGDRGRLVSVLQSLLAREGYHTNGIDSDFGPGTDRAVREYQAASGLDVDGVAGPTTWAALTRAGAEGLKEREIRLLTAQVLALQAERDGLLERIERAKAALSG
jgi:hypothetical protein